MLSLPRCGSNWIRYWFEYFSNENTSERNILVEKNHWGELRTDKTFATLYKRHELTKEEIKLREIEKIVLVLRDYKECFVRHCIGRNFESRVKRLNQYVDNLYTYDSFMGDKIIMYYEDFVLNPKESMQRFLNFLNIKNEWGDIDIEHHKNVSLNLYESGGLNSTGIQTRGSPSITKGCTNFQFHQKSLHTNTKHELDNWFTQNHGIVLNKYLKRYYQNPMVTTNLL
jgi:hypothetical protein